MSISRNVIVSFLAVSSLALGVGVASAGGHGYFGPGHGFGPGCASFGKHGANWEDADWQDFRAARHARLKKDLQITPEQESAWQAFTAQEVPDFKAEKCPAPEDFAKMNAPEREEARLEFLRRHQEFMTQRLSALKSFYAVLTPGQRKIFDDFHAPKLRQDKKPRK
ncbi:MAG: Spy/CpxP family protein refolding chaperone [Zoogloeaceae bacterium]|jgi:Spy/CpxP family protein refolding chaperone|nr:Spy/CpxP family protein refolding chaperone [Zoogloeaceae bacterium]